MTPPDISEMFDDLRPPDEDDPDFEEEMFILYKHMGATPESLPGLSKKEKKQYSKWLELHKNDKEDE